MIVRQVSTSDVNKFLYLFKNFSTLSFNRNIFLLKLTNCKSLEKTSFEFVTSVSLQLTDVNWHFWRSFK